MAERGRRRPGYPRLSLAAVLLAYCGIGAGGVHASSEALARSPVYEQDFEIDLETIAYQADWRLPREDGEAYVESDALRDSTVLVLERPEAGRSYARLAVSVEPGASYSVEALANGDAVFSTGWTGIGGKPGDWRVLGSHPSFGPVSAGNRVALEMQWRGSQTQTARAVYQSDALPRFRDGRIRTLVYLMQHGAAGKHFAAGILLRHQADGDAGEPGNYFVHLSGAGELRISRGAGSAWNERGTTLASAEVPIPARSDLARPYLLEIDADGGRIAARLLASDTFRNRSFGDLAASDDPYASFTEEVARLKVEDDAFRAGALGVAGYSGGGNKTARFLSIEATPEGADSATELVPRQRGAVLKAAFADADGNRLGETAAAGGRGFAEGWRSRSVRLPGKAPPGTDRLFVWLGIEGRGEARFDSLRVFQYADELRGFVPKEGDKVAVVRPEMRWKGDFKRYRLELSRDPDFPEGSVHYVYTPEASARPSRGLEPGTWYWRVRPWRPDRTGFQGAAGGVRSFEIPPEAGKWPPAVTPRAHWWAAGPRRSFEVGVSPLTPDYAVKAVVGGEPAELIERRQATAVFRPTVDLEPGLHELSVVVRDGEGREVTADGFLNNAEPGSVSKIGEGKIMRVDGDPFFPIGSYRDPTGERLRLDGAVEAGWNTMFSYYTAQSVEKTRRYLDAARERGLRVMLRFPGGWGYTYRDHMMEKTARWVARFAQHPAVVAWYLGDEPELYGFTPEDVRRLERLVEKTDPNTVTTMVSHFPRRHGRFGDVYMPMSYILGPFFGHTWEEPLDARAILRNNKKRQGIARARDVWGSPMAGERPIWAILQGFDPRHRDFREDYKAALEKHGPRDRPTYEETRNMAFAALAADVQGLFWWWHRKPNLLEQSPSVWEGIVRVSHELNDLMPYLETPATERDAFEPPDPLMAWTRATEGRRVLALVNPVVEPVEVEVDLGKFRVDRARDLDSGEWLSAGNGRLELHFDGHEVKLLEWREEEASNER